MRGDIGLASLILILLAFLILVWSFLLWRAGKRSAWRRCSQPYPRCVRCGYAMKGLTEARCPECGTRYTLDDLWVGQRDLPANFDENDEPPR